MTFWETYENRQSPLKYALSRFSLPHGVEGTQWLIKDFLRSGSVPPGRWMVDTESAIQNSLIHGWTSARDNSVVLCLGSCLGGEVAWLSAALLRL